MAMESELVTADMVEASEYPELSDSYQVYGVPLTVANNKVRVEGGGKKLLNPGTCSGYLAETATIALVETGDMAVEIVRLP